MSRTMYKYELPLNDKHLYELAGRLEGEVTKND